MVFGLFKRDKKHLQVQGTSSPSVPVNLDDSRLAQLGPVLWQDVRCGMTIAEVKGVRPDARPSAKDEKLGDGTRAELTIPHFQLGKHDYAVLFYFKSGTLTQTTIKSNGNPALSDFRDLTGALRLRYGQEAEMKESDDSFSTAEWLSNDGANISLVCYPQIGCLNVNFQYRYANAARQL